MAQQADAVVSNTTSSRFDSECQHHNAGVMELADNRILKIRGGYRASSILAASTICGCSSVGRARDFLSWGREFKSLQPHHIRSPDSKLSQVSNATDPFELFGGELKADLWNGVAKLVRHRTLTPVLQWFKSIHRCHSCCRWWVRHKINSSICWYGATGSAIDL